MTVTPEIIVYCSLNCYSAVNVAVAVVVIGSRSRSVFWSGGLCTWRQAADAVPNKFERSFNVVKNTQSSKAGFRV